MNDYILEVCNVSKSFPGVKALDCVSLNIRRGEVHALVGENGAGKSTLMRILSGAYPCTTYEGVIKVEGKKRAFHTPRHSEHAGIEMIYQEVSLIPDLTVAENIFVGNYPSKNGVFVKWEDMLTKARTALERVGLDLDPEEKVRNSSTSQQQMIAIAKAVYKNPKILVLDEPTSAITKTETEYLFRIINDLKSKGISCIYISHKLEEVFKIADRITVMRDGKIVGTVERGECSSDEIVNMMVGRKIENRYPKEKLPIGKEILRVENLSVPHKYVPGKKIVDNVSFSLKAGEILGLAGLVGAGRSELVNALFGHLKKEAGCKIYVDGAPVNISYPKDAINNGIALVSEDRRQSGIISILSIRENITLAALRKLFRSCFIKYSKERQVVDEYKKKLSIKAPDIETKVRNLSGGNQQKVVLSKWLINNPKILILDEPTRGIDVGAKYDIYNIMTELAKQGIGIIMISSELPELLGMCDRFLVVSNGRIVDEFTRDEASENRVMMAATDAKSLKRNV